MNDVSDIVFIVDDDALVRRSLEATLSLAGFKPAKFASAQQFLACITFQHSGCVLTDIRMPGMDGLELQTELVRRNLPVSVIVMTGHADVSLAVRAMQAGALDFLEKPFSNELLLTRVSSALAIASKKAEQASLMETHLQRFCSLSSRERDVLRLVIEGHSNKEIARTLEISQRTVDIHRARMMGKMQVTSVAALVRMAATIL